MSQGFNIYDEFIQEEALEQYKEQMKEQVIQEKQEQAQKIETLKQWIEQLPTINQDQIERITNDYLQQIRQLEEQLEQIRQCYDEQSVFVGDLRSINNKQSLQHKQRPQHDLSEDSISSSIGSVMSENEQCLLKRQFETNKYVNSLVSSRISDLISKDNSQSQALSMQSEGSIFANLNFIGSYDELASIINSSKLQIESNHGTLSGLSLPLSMMDQMNVDSNLSLPEQEHDLSQVSSNIDSLITKRNAQQPSFQEYSVNSQITDVLKEGHTSQVDSSLRSIALQSSINSNIESIVKQGSITDKSISDLDSDVSGHQSELLMKSIDSNIDELISQREQRILLNQSDLNSNMSQIDSNISKITKYSQLQQNPSHLQDQQSMLSLSNSSVSLPNRQNQSFRSDKSLDFSQQFTNTLKNSDIVDSNIDSLISLNERNQLMKMRESIKTLNSLSSMASQISISSSIESIDSNIESLIDSQERSQLLKLDYNSQKYSEELDLVDSQIDDLISQISDHIQLEKSLISSGITKLSLNSLNADDMKTSSINGSISSDVDGLITSKDRLEFLQRIKQIKTYNSGDKIGDLSRLSIQSRTKSITSNIDSVLDIDERRRIESSILGLENQDNNSEGGASQIQDGISDSSTQLVDLQLIKKKNLVNLNKNKDITIKRQNRPKQKIKSKKKVKLPIISEEEEEQLVVEYEHHKNEIFDVILEEEHLEDYLQQIIGLDDQEQIGNLQTIMELNRQVRLIEKGHQIQVSKLMQHFQSQISIFQRQIQKVQNKINIHVSQASQGNSNISEVIPKNEQNLLRQDSQFSQIQTSGVHSDSIISSNVNSLIQSQRQTNKSSVKRNKSMSSSISLLLQECDFD